MVPEPPPWGRGFFGPRSGIDWPCLAQPGPLRTTAVLIRPEQSLRLLSGSETGELHRKAGRGEAGAGMLRDPRLLDPLLFGPNPEEGRRGVGG